MHNETKCLLKFDSTDHPDPHRNPPPLPLAYTHTISKKIILASFTTVRLNRTLIHLLHSHALIIHVCKMHTFKHARTQAHYDLAFMHADGVTRMRLPLISEPLGF